MWTSLCLFLLFQALTPSLAVPLHRHPKHLQLKEDQVFLDVSVAHGFLGRKLLYNHWDFELIRPDNLERECIEEVCSYEEAREVFEDDVKTAEGPCDQEKTPAPSCAFAPFSGCGCTAAQRHYACTIHNVAGHHEDHKEDDSMRTKRFWETYPHNGKGGAKTTGVDVAGLVAGLIAALVSIVMFAVVAMYCFKYRAKERRRSRMQDNLYPGMALASFDEEPKPESAPGLPTYEQAMASSGVHDAPPPPYNRSSTSRTLPT